ncbi:MAG: hypothetical protein ABEJ65_02290, partial [bacterium]
GDIFIYDNKMNMLGVNRSISGTPSIPNIVSDMEVHNENLWVTDRLHYRVRKLDMEKTDWTVGDRNPKNKGKSE